VAQRGRAVGHLAVLFAGAGMVGLHRNGDFVDHRRHFRCRFPARLSGFGAIIAVSSALFASSSAANFSTIA
jgi:hypothetical protein